jgi:hypothetical protein
LQGTGTDAICDGETVYCALALSKSGSLGLGPPRLSAA